ncbi:MAG: efflux RND transporter periplasmic adaptor subunit [Candidatus Falkowbacteria bacterium]|nr:efflux RND transporter periplasmic adaptor subunit [Candidatus Falkowbacteria bacterium]
MAESILEASKKARKGLWGKFFKTRTLIIFLIVAAVAGASYYYYNKQNQNQATAVTIKQATAKKQDLKISISSSGKVVAKDGVELSFPVAGNLEVDQVLVKEGDKVKRGDKIASVKTQSLEFDLRNAYASYQSSLASFNSKNAAPTSAEINNSKNAIDQAQISLDQANISLNKTKSSASQSINNAQVALDNATNNLKLFQDTGDSQIIRDAYVSLLSTIKSISIVLHHSLSDSDSVLGIDNPSINDDFEAVLGAKDSTSLNTAKNSYLQTKSFQASLDNLTLNLDSANYSAMDAAATKANQALNSLQSNLYDMQKLLDATVTFVNLSQSKLDGFEATVNSDRASVNSAISSLNSATQAVRNARSSVDSYQITYDKAVNDLKVAKSQADQDINNATISVRSREIALSQAKTDYATLIAPIPEVDLASARAQLTSAAINVDKAKYNMEQATLISPIDGVVSMLNYKQGDIILGDSTAKTMATIINNDTLFIEVNIEEADISKLKVGEKAQATFDAVDGLTMNGEISFISLTSTTSSNGIVTYLVRVILSKPSDSPIREGMTANVEFITAEVPNVLAVPVTAVRNIGGKPAVELADGQIANVTTGFTDGKNVEISSGLKEGDTVVY